MADNKPNIGQNSPLAEMEPVVEDPNQPQGNEPSGNESQGNEPTGNEPQGNEPQGNEPSGNEPTGNEPSGNEPQGNEPTGNEPQGNEPQGNEPQGNEPQGNEPSEEVPKEKVEQEISNKLSEATGGNITTLDGATARIQELHQENEQLKQKTQFDGDPVQWIDEKLKEEQGIGIEEYVQYRNLDPDNMNEGDLMRKYLEVSEPGISDKEINIEMNKYSPIFKSDEEKKQMVENGDITNNQLEQLEREYNKTLRQAKQTLNEKKQKTQVESWQKSEEQKKQEQEDIKLQVQKTKDALSQVDKDVITLSDGTNLEYHYDSNDEQAAREFLDDPNIYKRWQTDDGRFNINKFKKDMHLLNNIEKRDQVIADKMKPKIRQEIMQEMNNASPGDNNNRSMPDQPANNDPKSKSPHEVVKERAMMNGR